LRRTRRATGPHSERQRIGRVGRREPQHTKENRMKTFVIRRRGNWSTSAELGITAGVSARVGNEEMSDRVRWIRSYVVREADGRLGTVCIYQGVDEKAIREHANRAGMTADEVLVVEDTVIVREDPVPTKAAA
jgi:hypothetical protein